MVKLDKLILSFLLLLSLRSPAQDLLISGGNTVSTIICANGFVFTWGNNKAGPATAPILGTLGNGSTLAIEPTPKQVIFPNNDPYFQSLSSGITVKAVDAGSGAHFVAVDCKGGAWSWGNNGGAIGITGTGSTAAATTQPGRVLRGEAPASPIASLQDYLVNVKYVSGGNDNSYVILEDGTALGWGRNTKGQLGNGTFVNSPTPVYIRDGATGQPLKNVIQVEAGDETGYALVDADGDGLATVYSWGAGFGQFGGSGMLGRNAAGTANSGTEEDNDNYARPVLKRDGTPLTGIVSISAADVMCLALDADGYVWAWGNNGWGAMTGQGATVGNHSDPRRVVAGEWGTTAGAGFGETFLKAKSVSGGQGFGMAVTIDGKPVAFGNNKACGTGGGGHLGDGGTNAMEPAPVFIRRSATVVDNNVRTISDGDTWGFYTTVDNKIYTWGNNNWGQLGLGTSGEAACQPYAKEFTLPPCTFPAPKPLANMAPRDFSVCTANWKGTVLNSGFTIAAALAQFYSVKWYLNGKLILDGDGDDINYKATQPGDYKVVVNYIGPDAPCEAYVAATDEISIGTYKQDFTVPTDLIFCPPTIKAALKTGLGEYEWYTRPTGGDLLGTSYRTDSITFPSAKVTEVNGDKYTVYVQQKGFVAGNTGKTSPAECTQQGQMGPPVSSNTMIRIYSDTVTIDTITAYQNSEYNGSKITHNWQVCVYGTKLTNGKPIADRNNVIACGPVVALPGVDQPGVGMIKIPVNIKLEGSATGTDYWLGFATVTNPGVGIYFKCNPAWPVKDDVPGGEYVNMVNIDNYSNPVNTPEWGLFANIKWHADLQFCTRVPVVITRECPLPVTLLSFYGYREGKGNMLKWATVSEKDSRRFAVQRSVDGVHFETIAYVKSENSAAGANYKYFDATAGSSYYYRLQEEDFDGNKQYSKEIYIDVNGSGSFSFLLNESNDAELEGVDLALNPAVFSIISPDGKVLFTETIHTEEKHFKKTFHLSGLAKGVYYYQLINTERKITGKFTLVK